VKKHSKITENYIFAICTIKNFVFLPKKQKQFSTEIHRFVSKTINHLYQTLGFYHLLQTKHL